MSEKTIFDDLTIRRLGKLTPQDRRTVTRLHEEGKPPGYIYGWITAGRKLRKSDEPKRGQALAGTERVAKRRKPKAEEKSG